MKPFLNAREKNIVVAVLSLQVINNIAMVIIEETSPGSVGWMTWRDLLHLVDIACCIAILYPIFWSINHFRQAAEADGKARDNLQKLQLFRQFYVMVLCYIYFTRVIVFLITATVPFYVQWLGQLCLELGTLLFFAITGYKFQPAYDNAYMKVESDEGDEGREYGLSERYDEAGVQMRGVVPSGVLDDEDDEENRSSGRKN
ncbi:Gpr107 [Symbiodinium microadriaticum]|nr:Gpr107 [Symbiodinium microadriaticum]